MQRRRNTPARRRFVRAGKLGIANSRIGHALNASLGGVAHSAMA
jgi:hypothetical protein